MELHLSPDGSLESEQVHDQNIASTTSPTANHVYAEIINVHLCFLSSPVSTVQNLLLHTVARAYLTPHSSSMHAPPH